MQPHMNESSQPRLGVTLRLTPSCLKSHFAESPTYKAATKILDTCCSVAMLGEAANYLRWNQRYTGPGYTLRLCIGILFAFESLLQLVWMTWYQRSWYRHRGTLFLTSRIVRLLHICLIPYFTHLTLNAAPSPSTPISPNPTPPTPPTTPHPPAAAMSAQILRSVSAPLSDYPLFTTAKLILLTSGTIAAVIPALSAPLPFLTQLTLQLLTTAFLLTYQIPVALPLLAHMLPPTGPQHQLCHTFNNLLYFVECLPMGATSEVPRLSSQCDAHATRLLSIAALLYVGLVLPVYFSYCLERYMKLLYLQREHGQGQQVSEPLMVDALLMGTLALVVWICVLQWHDQLGGLGSLGSLTCGWCGLCAAVT